MSNTNTAAEAASTFSSKAYWENGEILLTRRLAEIVELKSSAKFYQMNQLEKSIDWMMDIIADKIAEVLNDTAKDMEEIDNLDLEDSVELREQLDTIGSYALDLLSDAI